MAAGQSLYTLSANPLLFCLSSSSLALSSSAIAHTSLVSSSEELSKMVSINWKTDFPRRTTRHTTYTDMSAYPFLNLKACSYNAPNTLQALLLATYTRQACAVYYSDRVAKDTQVHARRKLCLIVYYTISITSH